MFLGISDYGAFVAAIVLFLAIPGPGNLALIPSTSKGGMAGRQPATMALIADDQCLSGFAGAAVSTAVVNTRGGGAGGRGGGGVPSPSFRKGLAMTRLLPRARMAPAVVTLFLWMIVPLAMTI